MIVSELYSLTFPNGKLYVGMTTRGAAHRLRQHCWLADRGSNYAVHAALRRYDHQATLRVLVVGPTDYISELEAKVIKSWSLLDKRFGYNLSPGSVIERLTERRKAMGMIGNQHAKGTGRTPEQRAQRSLRAKRMLETPEGRQQLQIAQATAAARKKGRPLSEPHKAALALAQQARFRKQEERDKISATFARKALVSAGAPTR